MNLEIISKKNRIIFVDWGILSFRSIHVFRNNPSIPLKYTILNILLGCLKRVGVTPEDKIIIACDKGKSWRKQVDSDYKSNRKEKREAIEPKEWWDKVFMEADITKSILDCYTPFYIMEENHIEADDIISYGVRYFKDYECIVISADSDFEQLVAFKNVKLFSPITKNYKLIKNPYHILASKIAKEKADNLNTPITTEEEFQKRLEIVTLLELPKEIENKIEVKIRDLFDYKKEFQFENIPFNGIRERFKNIYKLENVVKYGKPNKKKKKEAMNVSLIKEEE